MIIRFRNILLICLLMSISGAILAIDFQESWLDYAWNERFTTTNPPQAPVRSIAEFEPAEAVLIRYPLGIPTSLVLELANTVELICLVGSNSQQNSATSSFLSAGVDMDQVSFIIANTDSYWTRDYSPIFIFDGNLDYGLVDFRYNRPRPNDNLVPEIIADELQIPYFGMNLYQTGGNYMSDGLGGAVQSHIAYTENGNNPTVVDGLMQDFLGITNYHVVQDPNDTYIDHVDCWGKFLAPDKILIRRVPSYHPQYNSLEDTADYFASQICAWGYPYRVYRVDTPGDQPYSNSLILNKRVFVPVMNSGWDAAALQVYAEAMPGYEIVPVMGSGYTPWQSTDALHCRTHEVPDAQMLYIAHQPYYGMQNPADEYSFEAQIIPHSNTDCIADSTYLAYRINSGEWQINLLQADGGYEYSAAIPGPAVGDTIRYYIHAADNSGRSRSHPQFAELDPHYFVLEGAAEAPTISHNPIDSIAEDEVSLTVIAEDESEIAEVLVIWQVDEGEIQSGPMSYAGNNIYLYSIFPDFEDDAELFHYQISASDVWGNQSWLPAEDQRYTAQILPVSNEDSSQVPAALSLRSYPNPLRRDQALCLNYEQEKAGPARLSIYNLRGQLIFEEKVQAQSGQIHWDGRDMRGNKSTNGIYFLRFEAHGKSSNRKLIIAH